MALTRREFLKNIGAGSLFLMAMQSGILSAAVIKEIEEAMARGDESWVNSVCQLCPGACGIRVRKIGPWPIAIAGNPLHPINRGALCPKGIAGILSFYDPDRIQSPLKRVGERGAGKWGKISWEEALSSVAQELAKLRQEKETHKVAVLGGRYSGLMRTLFERFLEAYGSPNYIDNSFATWQGSVEALEKTQGVPTEPTYDLEKTRYVLSFGAPLLEAGRSPVENLRGWAKMRRGNPAHRGKVIQIETRLSVTAAKADEWISIHPGTEGLLALGIIYIILREDLYDGFYLGEHSEGFSNFKSLVVQNYSAETISKLTGVSIDTILRLAREFATTKPALAISGRIDPKDQIAIYTLNALAGSINVPGGVLLPRQTDYQKMDPAQRDEVAQAGHAKGKAHLMSGDPYALKALFFYYTNPLFSNAQPKEIQKVFSKIPFLVSFSPFMDETSTFCDLILPDHHFLERWQDVPSSTIEGFPLMGLSQPIRLPLHRSRHTGDVILQLAKKMGGSLATALPWEDYRAFLGEGLKRLYDSKQGDVFGTSSESSWTTLLSRGGWWAPSYENFEDFQKQLEEKGGWWDPIYFHEEWARVFSNEAAKFEFPKLKDFPLIMPKGDEGFPLYLNSFPLMALTGGRNAGQAWLADIAGPHIQEGWKTWVEINPETAQKFGIKDKDLVWVESSLGRIQVIAKLYEGTHPKVISIPLGFGHTAMGRWAKGIGENPRTIQESDTRRGGMPRETVTRVKIYKA